MKILLLSLNTGAVAPFLTEAARVTDRALRVGYALDAQAAYLGLPFVEAERERIRSLGYEVVPLMFRELAPAQLDAELEALDAIYVASGSTFALLESLRVTGNDEIVLSHVKSGLPYIGSSAGSIIAGPDVAPAALMDSPADGPLLNDTKGLGLVSATVIPHADGKLPPYPSALIDQTLETFGAEYALQPLRDDQALLADEQGESVIFSGV